jgi:exopolysaccharide production protein ExoQ
MQTGSDEIPRSGGYIPPPYNGIRSGIRTGPLIAICDWVFAFLVIFSSVDAFSYLFIHTFLWMAAYGYILLRLLMSMEMFLGFCTKNWQFLLYPALSLISVLWSDTPKATIMFSIQLWFSVLMALFIGMRFSLSGVFWLLMIILAVTMFLSFINMNGMFTYPYGTGERATFKGIFLGKSAFGHRAILFVVGCVFIVFLLPGVRLIWRGLFLLNMFATLFMVIVLSGSATGILLSIGLAGVSITLHILFIVRGGAALVILPSVVIFAVGLLGVLIAQVDPITLVLDLLGRDASMTGRTDIWSFGWEIYFSRPVLGMGMGSFWNSGYYAHDIASIRSQHGETVNGFHNLLIEVLVGLGPMGVLAHALMGWTAIQRAISRLIHQGDTLAIWAGITVFCLYLTAFISPSLYNGHTIPIILLIAIGAALSKDAPAPRARPAFTPNPAGTAWR